MSNNRVLTRRAAYGPTFVMTFDEVKEMPSEDAAISRKLDKILDALEREIKGDRPTPQQSLEAAIAEIMKKYEGDARRQGIDPFPEAPGMDYAAMNPHKSRDKRPATRTARDSARRPMSVCEQCAAAYAARNPHKR